MRISHKYHQGTGNGQKKNEKVRNYGSGDKEGPLYLILCWVTNGVLDSGEKVRVENAYGVVTPRILPSSPEIAPDNKRIKITVDARDEKLIPTIQQKYENDTTGQWYSSILYNVAHEVEGALDGLDKVHFEGNWYQDPSEPPLCQFIDYSNKKCHIIAVINNRGHLSCLVKFFGTFSLFIIMSDKPYLNKGDIRLYFNDFSKHSYDSITQEDLVTRMSVEKVTEHKFDKQDMTLLGNIIQKDEVGFCVNMNGDNIVYNQAETPLMTEEMLIISLTEDRITDTVLDDGHFSTTYQIPLGHYFMIFSAKVLIQLIEITKTTVLNKY